MTDKKITQKDARSLAVAYGAFSDAVANENDNGIAVWGEALKEAQEVTGIELHTPHLIDVLVRAARRGMGA